jgi:hypothetical protein
MKLFGDWNWYLPTSFARVLRVRRDQIPQAATEPG